MLVETVPWTQGALPLRGHLQLVLHARLGGSAVAMAVTAKEGCGTAQSEVPGARQGGWGAAQTPPGVRAEARVESHEAVRQAMRPGEGMVVRC